MPLYKYQKTVSIKAPAVRVWESLTHSDLISEWMTDVNISSAWTTDSPITMRGTLHGVTFENKGTVLLAEPRKILRYSFWSSLSQTSDVPENYSIMEFRLRTKGSLTELSLTQTDFAEEVIFQHARLYWDTTLGILKNFIEKSPRFASPAEADKKNSMKHVPVTSSLATSLGYDSATGTLEIQFRSGEIWHYLRVPETVFNEMTTSTVGRFFQQHIKNQYEEVRVK